MSTSRDSWCWRRSPSFLGCWLIITKLSDQILTNTTPAPRSCQLVETGGKCGKWKVASEVKWWFRLQLRGATLRPSSDEITRKYVEGTFNILRSELFLSCVCCLNIKVPLCINETSRVPSRNNGGIEWEKRGTEKNGWKNWILKITDVNKEAA